MKLSYVDIAASAEQPPELDASTSPESRSGRSRTPNRLEISVDGATRSSSPSREPWPGATPAISAADLLRDPWRQVLFHASRRHNVSGTDGDDLVAEVVLRFVAKPSLLNVPAEAIEPTIWRVADYVARNLRRRRNGDVIRVQREADRLHRCGQIQSTPAQDDVESFINQSGLKVTDRQLTLLRLHFEGQSSKEIALALSSTTGAVRALLCRTHASLRTQRDRSEVR